MQFKMAENSLFAVLLRSPWWYSMLIASAMVLLVQALLGTQYLIFGVFAALPFIGIGAYAAYRQMQMPGSKQIEQTEQAVRDMPAREFTDLLSASYQAQGYEVAPHSGNAADLELEKGWRIILVACKRVKAATIGTEPLRALKEAGKKREATGLIYVAIGEISDNARKFAADNNIEFVGVGELSELLGNRLSK